MEAVTSWPSSGCDVERSCCTWPASGQWWCRQRVLTPCTVQQARLMGSSGSYTTSDDSEGSDGTNGCSINSAHNSWQGALHVSLRQPRPSLRPVCHCREATEGQIGLREHRFATREQAEAGMCVSGVRLGIRGCSTVLRIDLVCSQGVHIPPCHPCMFPWLFAASRPHALPTLSDSACCCRRAPADWPNVLPSPAGTSAAMSDPPCVDASCVPDILRHMAPLDVLREFWVPGRPLGRGTTGSVTL